jgi:hypothetical protein
MNNKLLSAMILILFIITVMPVNVSGQDEEMKKNALQSMRQWSNTIDPAQFVKLGYKDKAEFDKAVLGDPYIVYTIAPEQLLEYQPGKDFSSLLTKSGYIVYPVISDGKNKSLLWMYEKDNQWKIAKIGSAGLSENLKTSEAAIQKNRETYKLASAEKPRMVRIYQLYLDLFYIKGEQSEYLVPMQTIPEMKIRGGMFYQMQDILPILQEEMKQKMPFKDKDGNILEQ